MLSLFAGSTASSTFTALVQDLSVAVSDNSLSTAIYDNLGTTVDVGAFVAPASWVNVQIRVTSHAPTSSPTIDRPKDYAMSSLIITLVAVGITLILMCLIGVQVWVKLKLAVDKAPGSGFDGVDAVPTAEVCI